MFNLRYNLHVSALVLVLGTKMLHAQFPAMDPTLVKQLRRDDEILLKAVHTGDRSAWQKLTAPDFFYLDEEGGVTYLHEFLRQLAPMNVKPLRIRTYKVTRAGGTAVVLHEDDDDQKVHYIFSETWQKLNGSWRLRVLHITNVLSDPPEVQLTSAQIDELTGSYHAGLATSSIRREGTRIFYQQEDGPAIEQKAETRDTLFTKGSPRERRIFVRSASGQVSGFILRYESSDTLWSKVQSAAATP